MVIRTRRLLCVLLGIIALFAGMGLLMSDKQEVVLYVRTGAMDEIEVYLFEHDVDEAVSGIPKVATSLQAVQTNGEQALFVPQYMNIEDVYVVWSAEKEGEIFLLDGQEISEDKDFVKHKMGEGVHEMRIGTREFDFRVLKSAPIPSVWLTTQAGLSYLWENKENETEGDLCVLDASGNSTYSGNVASLRGRGNTSWDRLKKSYNLKLNGEYPLLGMSTGKAWVLQSGAIDSTCIRNKLFYDMAIECGMPNAVESRIVDLYIDNVYQGCYLLCERITVANGRLEIGDLEKTTYMLLDEEPQTYPRYIEEYAKGYCFPTNPRDISGGYLMEVEAYKSRYDGERSGFVTALGLPMVFKSPKYASVEQVQYMKNFVQECEDALMSPDGINEVGRSYLEYIDLDSFVLQYVIDEVSKNIDAGYSSCYFYKPKGDSVMYAGPVWDYDTALGNNAGWGDSSELQNPEGLYIVNRLWQSMLYQQDAFYERSVELYQERVSACLQRFVEQDAIALYDSMKDSIDANAYLYGHTEIEEDMKRLVDFLEKRKNYLDALWI